MHRYLVFLGLLSACCEPGSGDLVSESRAISSVSELVIDVPGRVTLSPGPAGVLKITTDDNLIDQVETEVRDGRLVVGTGDHCCIDPTELSLTMSGAGLESIAIDGSAEVTIAEAPGGPDLELSIDGSGDIRSRVPLIAESVVLSIDGSGSMSAELDVQSLRSSIDGSGFLSLTGAATDHRIDIDGSGDIDAFELATSTTSITIDGSGACDVAVSERLDVDIDGSGDVGYCGEPELSQRIDGSGSVSARCRL